MAPNKGSIKLNDPPACATLALSYADSFPTNIITYRFMGIQNSETIVCGLDKMDNILTH